ncbi:ATP-binding protein [Gammaproteobacteria bacterium]|nr:ATP-binding protein [Gammaproteobacteria bacterium]
MGIGSRLFLIIFVSLGLGIFVSYIIAERDITDTFQKHIINELQNQASLLAEVVDEVDSIGDLNEADSLADRLGSASNSRVTLILSDGRVIGDSNVDTQNINDLDNHANRPEVQDAFLKGRGWSIRYSDTVKQQQMYYAILDNNDVSPNVIRIAVPYVNVDSAIGSLNLSIILIALVAFIVTSIASGVAANYAYRSIADLADATSKIADADGKAKKKDLKALPTERTDEFGNVAQSVSQISEELKSKINLIAKQRDQFGSVLDDLGEGIIVADIGGKITYENEQVSLILNKNELVGKKITDLNIKSLNYLLKRAKKKKRADIEFEIELNDRSTRWVLATINQSKTTKEFILVVHDITQLRRFSSMRRDFISNVSHELRTPVSVIMANSETLVDGALEDKKQAKVFAKAILHNAERLSDMVSSLLDLSRIDYGELKLNIEELHINEHIDKAIDSIKHLGKRKNITIKCSCSIGKIVLADKNALERILNNLIENAFKYSDADSTINISTRKVKDHLEISVKDSGRGIPNEEQDFLFDRFYRTAEARATEEKGSGLGLAIVKNLVNNLNGEVGVKNAMPQGSIFWFTLPLKS